MNRPAYLSRFVGAMGFMSFVVISGFWKLSFWVGSQKAFFSAVNCIAPLSGVFGGVFGSLLCFTVRMVVRFCLGSIDFTSVFHGVPTLCASLYWASTSVYIRVIIPLVCMCLFLAHPIGFQAGIYTSYWILPIGIALSSTRSIFLQALASTFVAHAVGSVAWLYTTCMPCQMWIALMPVVAIERLLFAAGMVCAYHCIVMLHAKLYGKKQVPAFVDIKASVVQ